MILINFYKEKIAKSFKYINFRTKARQIF